MATTPTASKQLTRLTGLLKALFQLDQPELDFGLYKIMHAKSREITRFLEQDLLREVESALGNQSDARLMQAQITLDAAIHQAQLYGAPDPEAAPIVQDARAAYAQAADSSLQEADIYDHLYRFFERYYDNGDFLSRRYYARESDSRAAPYSVPFDGREVYLHWANKDQYYIKSSETLSHFSFDLTQSVRQLHHAAGADNPSARLDGVSAGSADSVAAPAEPALKVHLRIAQATEGEHGNLKTAGEQKREFIALLAHPAEFNPQGELILNFEYKVLPGGLPVDEAAARALMERYDFSAKGDVGVHWMADVFLQALQKLAASPEPAVAQLAPSYARLLATPAPTDKQKKRPLLAKYIAQYTARNTMDYFIHKDLGGFLRRELDFYIKNEIMRLDDIEQADAPRVEQYLGKIKVLRRIAHPLIAFVAQLEDFQKKLWLKKKFVTQTNYCLTLDRVPPALYPAIAANETQRAEWVRLFAIDDIAGDLAHVGYSVPLTVEFLQANPFLLVDTALFDETFKDLLLASVADLDAQCDGVLIHSENFQALELMQQKYREQVKCIYIDPPYNTGGDGFAYRDNYQHSSWLSMFENRAFLTRNIMRSDSVFFCSTDDIEQTNSKLALGNVFGMDNFISNIIWQKKYAPANDSKWLSDDHDYISCFALDRNKWFPIKLDRSEKQDQSYKNPDDDPRGLWRADNYKCNKSADERPNLYYSIINPNTDEEIWPARNAVWRYSKEYHDANVKENLIWWGNSGKNSVPAYKRFLSNVGGRIPQTIWMHTEVGHNQDGIRELRDLLPETPFTSPKTVNLVKKLAYIAGGGDVLDYFAGSGTTAHAVISLNREDGGKRKYILVEQNYYFDTALKPRIQKAIYSKDWRDGKPVARDGISHCFKYLRLESYEDTLNNLALRPDAARDAALNRDNPNYQRDYLLHYWLDVETRGSQSLLNIDAIRDPAAYTLMVKKPGSDAQAEQRIDLVETFNWLIGLWVTQLGAPIIFDAEFEREPDPDLPQGGDTHLLCVQLEQRPLSPQSYMPNQPLAPVNTAQAAIKTGFWLRLVEGYTLKVPGDNSTRQKTLVVWRKLSDDAERDNAVLETFLLHKLQTSPPDAPYALIYVNGSSTLAQPLLPGLNTPVRLIEEAFHNAMWSQAQL